METPTRPFTIGGQTLSQAHPKQTPPQRPEYGSEQKKTVSFRSSMFPSPPAHRTSFTSPQQQQQQVQQHNKDSYYNTSNATAGPSSQVSDPSHSTSSSLPRSTSAPHVLPAPSTSRTSPSNRQMTSYAQPGGQQVVSSLDQRRSPTKQTSRPQVSGTSFDSVPADPRLVLEARKNTMAKRLRVNLVLLLAWYLATDSRLYSYLAELAINAYPASRSPLIWTIGRLLPAMLLYNAGEAFLSVRSTSLPVSAVTTVQAPLPPQGQSVDKPREASYARSMPISTATYKSSPKTRPSANMLPSPSMPERFRPSTGGQQHETPSTMPPQSHKLSGSPGQAFRPEAGVHESPTSALRRALLSARTGAAGLASPAASAGLSSSTSMPSGLASTAGPTNRERASPRVQAYLARSETTASPLHRSIRSEKDIDLLLASSA